MEPVLENPFRAVVSVLVTPIPTRQLAVVPVLSKLTVALNDHIPDTGVKKPPFVIVRQGNDESATEYGTRLFAAILTKPPAVLNLNAYCPPVNP
jgi:hypothetical protein